jgi:hypothetical protein
MTDTRHPDDELYARIYENGRRRGLADCPCGGNPGAADPLTYEDGVRECEDTHALLRRRWRVAEQERTERSCRRAYRNGLRVGSMRALVGVALLGLAAIGLRGRR